MKELTLAVNAQDSNAVQLDFDLESIIKSNLENANKLSLWALDSYSVLTAVSARADDLEKQGLLGKFWGSVTGQNRKMSIHNQQDLAHAQMLAQEMLVKLSEQNAISFEIAVSLGDKLSLLEQDFADAKLKINDAFGKTQEQIKGIYQNLNQFFDKVKSKIEELEAEFRRNDDLLFWKETLLEHKVYNGLYYEDMNNAQKILCMVQEFFTVTNGHWNSRDISFLRSSLRSVGITPDMPIKPLELVQQVQNDPGLLEHLVSKTSFASEFSGLMLDMPLLASLKQTIDVKGSEKHVIDTIAGFSPDAKVENIENAYIANTLLSKFGRSLEAEHKAFDVAVDLLGDLLLVELRHSQEKNTQIAVKSDLPVSEKGSFDYANPRNPFVTFITVRNIFVDEGQFVHKDQVLASFVVGLLGKQLYFIVAIDDFKITEILGEEGEVCIGALFKIDKDISNQYYAIIKAEQYFEANGHRVIAINLSELDIHYLDDELDSLTGVTTGFMFQNVGNSLDITMNGIGESEDDEYSSMTATKKNEELVVVEVSDGRQFDLDEEVAKAVSVESFKAIQKR